VFYQGEVAIQHARFDKPSDVPRPGNTMLSVVAAQDRSPVRLRRAF
jgi:hypothetical protein